MKRKLFSLFLTAFVGLSSAIAQDDLPTLALPSDLTQYLHQESGNIQVVPVSVIGDRSAEIQIIQGVNRNLPTHVKVRQSYGGVYPYVVVKSRENYVIVSQDKDILVVGLKDPQRAVIPKADRYVLRQSESGSYVVSLDCKQPPVDVIYVKNRLDLSVVLPPAVPADLLTKQDLFRNNPNTTHEATFEPNQRLAYSITRQIKIISPTGKYFEVYQVNLR